MPLERLQRGRAPWLTAPAPTQAPAHADESLPVLTSAVLGNDPRAAVPASAPVPAAGGHRHTWEIGASILVVAVVAVGAFVYFDTPAPPSAAKSGGGFVDAPEPAVLTNARPAPTAPADVVGVGNAPPAVAETRTAATAPIDVAIRRSVTQPAAAAAVKATQAGKARGTPRAPNVATALAVPRPDRPEPSWQAPAPVRAACTPTVAALGLCAAPPTQSKE